MIPDPQGIDFQIQRMQLYLQNLTWVDKIYGRATIQRQFETVRGSNRQREVKFPEVWGKNREPENVMPNDNLKAYIFFIAHDPGNYIDYDPGIQQMPIERRVSVILWCNLSKLDSTNKYRYSENLKIQLLQVLNFFPGFIIENDEEEYENVLREFTLDGNARAYLKPPYYGLRVTGMLHYKMFSENVCGTVAEVFPLPDYTQARIDALFEMYAPKTLDFIVGTDIEAGNIVAILRPYGFGNADNPLALSEVEILSVIWQNTPIQGVTVSGETMNFTVMGGLPDSSTITIMFRKKIPV